MEEDEANTWKTILAGSILAIAIGSVTGGLQHFPDSPERSLLIIPIGYIISLYFFASIHKYRFAKKEYIYMGVSSILTLVLTIGTYLLIEHTGLT
jgi:hypothetical protein